MILKSPTHSHFPVNSRVLDAFNNNNNNGGYLYSAQVRQTGAHGAVHNLPT